MNGGAMSAIFMRKKKANLMKMPNRVLAFYYGVTTATLLTPLHAR